MIAVTATPNDDIMNSGSILWEVTWQKDLEPPQGKLIMMPPGGWADPILEDFLPREVIKALIEKYGLNG